MVGWVCGWCLGGAQAGGEWVGGWVGAWGMCALALGRAETWRLWGLEH